MDSVEPFGSGFRQLHHPDGNRLQAHRFVAPDDVADDVLFNCIWFDNR